MSECPGIDQLDALIAGHLPDETFAEVESHVDTCRHCQSRLERLCDDGGIAALAPRVDSLAEPKWSEEIWNRERADRMVDAVRNAYSTIEPVVSIAGEPAYPEIPGHEVLDCIGRGGMGTVYRGTQLDLGREVAIKLLDTRREADIQQLTKRFSHEAQVTANLDHPSIVPVHAIGQDANGRCYYTMRLIRGHELREILKLARSGAGGWSRSRAVGLLIRVCQTMAFAHTHGVVHRDLKPSNVMVGDLGEVYVLDWGLAKVVGKSDVRDLRMMDSPGEHPPTPPNTGIADAHAMGSTVSLQRDDSQSCCREPIKSPGTNEVGEQGEPCDSLPLLTKDGSVIGTPTYMPPEQAAGHLNQINHRSDIYAIGTMLYELLTGIAPYTTPSERPSSARVLRAVLDGPPHPISRLAPDAPPELVAICDKAMARAANQRYDSALDMASDLEAFLEQRVVKAYQTGAWAEARKWVMRNRVTAAAAIGILTLGIVSFTGHTWWQAKVNRDLARANQSATDALEQQQRTSRTLERTNSKLQATSKELQASNSKLESVNSELGSTVRQLESTKSQLETTNNRLESANTTLETTNQQLAQANMKTTEALNAESAAKESERVAKLHAFSLLAESYANFGEMEAADGQYAHAALWFANAANLIGEKPDIQHTHRMRAMQYRRAAPMPVAAWWDNAKLQEKGWLEWPMTSRLYFNPTDQFLLWRGGVHPNQKSTAHWLKNRIFDLHNTDRPLWSNAIYDAAAFSPDGQHVAVSPKAGRVSIHRLSDEEQVQSLPPLGENAQPITILEYSHDGQRLFVGTSPARIWDIAQTKFLSGAYATGGNVVDVGFSQDDRQFLTVEKNNERRLFDIKDENGTHKPVEATKDDAELLAKFTFRQRLNRAQQQPDGTDVDSGWLEPFGNHDGLVNGFGFTSDGRWMAKAHGNGVLRLWQISPPKPYWFIRTSGWARPVFSADSSQVAAVGHYYVTWRDGLPASDQKPELLSTQVFDPATGQPLGPELKTGAAIIDGCFSPDGRTLVLACGASERTKDTVLLRDGKGGALQFWDWKAGTRTGEPLPMPSEAQSVAWHPQQNLVAVGCAAGEVMKVDVAGRKATQIFDGKMDNVPSRYLPGDFCDCGVAFDATGELLLWWGFGSEKHIFNFESGKIRYTPRTDQWCTGLELRGDSLLINNASGTGPAPVRSWNQDKWLLTAKESVSHLSRDGRYVASTGRDGTTFVGDVTARKAACPQIDSAGLDVGFIEGTPFLITAGGWRSPSCWVEFWDYRLGRQAAPRLNIPASHFVGFIRVTADGRFAAMSCQPYGLLVVDLRSFHEDPLQGLSAEDALMLSEIQTREQIQGGRLVNLSVLPGKPVMVHEWLDRWNDFRRRHPEFLRHDTSPALAIRDHQTRAHEFEVQQNPTAAAFHRRMADQLLSESERESKAGE